MGICSGYDVIFLSYLCSTSNTGTNKAKWDVQSNVEIGKLLSEQQLGSNELFHVAW